MRIVLVSEVFADDMGYIANRLPEALAELGHEVHLVTSVAKPYFAAPFYEEVYEPFLGPRFVEPVQAERNGYRLYRLPLFCWRGRIGLKGLGRLIDKIDPDVVEVFVHSSMMALQLAWRRPLDRYRFFTANHVLASVFPPAKAAKLDLGLKARLALFSWLPGRFVSLMSEACHPATVDAADIAARFFGVQKHKLRLMPLGVDTSHFIPPTTEEHLREREQLRNSYGISDGEIVCLYTGRFSANKNPFCLAEAISLLRERGEPFSGLFVGDGPQGEAIGSSEGCRVLPFVPFSDLPPIYRAADIGVWPREESTSVLDGGSAGLPVVISDQVFATERIEGNGLTYRENDPEDLARVLTTLLDPVRRTELGQAGRRNVLANFSWHAVAQRRLEGYEGALG